MGGSEVNFPFNKFVKVFARRKTHNQNMLTEVQNIFIKNKCLKKSQNFVFVQ